MRCPHRVEFGNSCRYITATVDSDCLSITATAVSLFNILKLKFTLKGYCTVSSLMPEISLINRYLREKQIAENPIKNSNPNSYYRRLNFMQIRFLSPAHFLFVVTHRLGSGTGSGCKYRELVSEVRQGAVLNLFLPRMRRTVDFLWREG